MPGGRPPLCLDEHREFITTSIQVLGLTREEVVDELSKSHGLAVSRGTLRRRLLDWGIRTQRANFSDSPALRVRLQHYFHNSGLTDLEISETLTRDEGFDISPKRVAKCRKEMGLYKRVDADKRGVAERTVEELLKKELEENEAVRELGQKALYKHLRSKYNVTGRDRIFTIAKRLDPEGPERRSRAQRKGARRSGLRKEREAKAAEEEARRQQQQQPGGEHLIEQQQHEQPRPEYVPLDPTMYDSNYGAYSQQPGVPNGDAAITNHLHPHHRVPQEEHSQVGEGSTNSRGQLQCYYPSSITTGVNLEEDYHYARGLTG